jgi:hypothetical protein
MMVNSVAVTVEMKEIFMYDDDHMTRRWKLAHGEVLSEAQWGEQWNEG